MGAIEYTVDGEGFVEITKAIAAAHAKGVTVVDARNGRVCWSPAPKKATRKVRHVLVREDGSEVEFGSVRNGGLS